MIDKPKDVLFDFKGMNINIITLFKKKIKSIYSVIGEFISLVYEPHESRSMMHIIGSSFEELSPPN